MQITKEFHFEASHVLHRHPGKCSRLHGHSWKVRVEIAGDVNRGTGFVMDYAELSAKVDPIIDRLDHRHLNNFVKYPSAENLAAHIAHELRPILTQPEGSLSSCCHQRLIIRVSETEKTWAVWDSWQAADVAMLDNSPPEAEWRSPHVKMPTDVEELQRKMEETSENAAELLRRYELMATLYEQYRLYGESLRSIDSSVPVAREGEPT